MTGVVREKRVVEIVVDAKQFKAATKDVNRNLRMMSKQAQRTADTFQGLISVWTVFEVARITKDFVLMTAEVERLDTVMRGAVGSQEDFADSMEFLRDTSQEFGLAMSDLQKGYSSLAGAGRAMGLSMAEINDLFMGLSVSAAAFQVSGAELNLMLQGAQQLAGSATVNMEDLRQVMERIPNAMDAALFATRQLTGQLSLNGQEMRKLIAEGKIATDEFLPLFAERLEQINLPAATENSKTFLAELNRLNNELKELLRTLIDAGLLKALGDLVSALADATKEASRLFKAFDNSELLDNITGAFERVSAAIDDVAIKAPNLTDIVTRMANPFRFLQDAATAASAAADQSSELFWQKFEEEWEKDMKGFQPTMTSIDIMAEQEAFAGGDFGTPFEMPKPTTVKAPRGGGSAARDTSAEDAARALQEQIDALQDLQEQLDPTIELWREYTETTLLLDNARKEGLITQQQMVELERQAGEQLQKNLDDLTDTAEKMPQLALDIGDAFADAFAGMITGAMSFEDALANLESQLIATITQALILEPLKAGLEGVLGGGSFFTSAFGGGITGVLARQGGGPVEAGRPYMVGEAGPEVVIPRQSGTVVPNNQIGGQTIVVNFNAPVQGEGLRQSAQQIAAQTGAQVNRAVQRNG